MGPDDAGWRRLTGCRRNSTPLSPAHAQRPDRGGRRRGRATRLAQRCIEPIRSREARRPRRDGAGRLRAAARRTAARQMPGLWRRRSRRCSRRGGTACRNWVTARNSFTKTSTPWPSTITGPNGRSWRCPMRGGPICRARAAAGGLSAWPFILFPGDRAHRWDARHRGGWRRLRRSFGRVRRPRPFSQSKRKTSRHVEAAARPRAQRRQRRRRAKRPPPGGHAPTVSAKPGSGDRTLPAPRPGQLHRRAALASMGPAPDAILPRPTIETEPRAAACLRALARPRARPAPARLNRPASPNERPAVQGTLPRRPRRGHHANQHTAGAAAIRQPDPRGSAACISARLKCVWSRRPRQHSRDLASRAAPSRLARPP